MPVPELTRKQVVFLRGRAHPLEPRVFLGKAGVTDAVRRELELAFAAAELVKLRLGRHVAIDLAALAAEHDAVFVQQVGRVAVLYRPAAEPVLRLPEA